MIPKPFKRPLVELNRTGRRWVTAFAGDLAPGDILQDHGLVSHMGFDLFEQETTITFVSGQSKTFSVDELVMAFTEAERRSGFSS